MGSGLSAKAWISGAGRKHRERSVDGREVYLGDWSAAARPWVQALDPLFQVSACSSHSVGFWSVGGKGWRLDVVLSSCGKFGLDSGGDVQKKARAGGNISSLERHSTILDRLPSYSGQGVPAFLASSAPTA